MYDDLELGLEHGLVLTLVCFQPRRWQHLQHPHQHSFFFPSPLYLFTLLTKLCRV